MIAGRTVRGGARWWVCVSVAVLIAPLALMAVGVAPAAAAALTLPNLRILVPTNLVSIGLDSSTGHRQLRYTHITENAGTGPFEIDPVYNPSTGIASFEQSIYTSTGPGVWAFDHRVQVAVNGAFVNGSDYRFPLTRFTLNQVNPDGSIGAVDAVSPKTDYCITGDNRVGDVPNTPTQTTPPAGNCADPTRPLGWSVGWGDQYDQTDSGQPIDINGLPDGSYVLRATADPQHVLTESDPTDNVTDTVLTIRGTTVTVGPQTHPVITPPTVAVAGPPPGSGVSGSVTLSVTAAATAPATVTAVQYLLDGDPLGAPRITAPYDYTWTVGSTPPGSHRLSAQVTDSTGAVGTAPVLIVTVTPSIPPTGFGVDQSITRTGHGAVTTDAFSTAAAGETLLALVSSDGPKSAAGQTASVSGAGVTWTMIQRANAQAGDAEIWQATAAGPLSGVTVTSTPSAGNFDQQLTVLTFTGSSGVGSASAASASTGAPTVGLTAAAAGAVTYAVGEDWDAATPRTVGAGQLIVSQTVDTSAGDTFWTQRSTAGSAAAGQPVTVTDTAPTTDRWNLAAVQVIPTTPPSPPPADHTSPTIALTNPAAGQTVTGNTPVAATATDDVAIASVQFTLDGHPLGSPVTTPPFSVAWDTTTATAGNHTLSATATDTSGNIGTAAPIGVRVQNPAPPMTCFVLQTQHSVHGRNTVTTPAVTTAMPGEVLLALVGSDGPATPGTQTTSISGAGLTWTPLARANRQYGDSEIWTATAGTVLTNVTVTSTPGTTGYDQDLTVIAMEGVAGIGALAFGSAATGTPQLTLTTTAAASLVFAVGNDWDRAAARTLPTGQVPLDQWVDTNAGDTFWSQYTNQAVTPTGTPVRIATTAPTNDRWNLTAVELRGEAG